MDYEKEMDVGKFLAHRRFSSIVGYPPDPQKFPLYYQAKRYEVTLHPKEMLFIPAGWFHYVQTEANGQPNVAISYFMRYKECGICDVLKPPQKWYAKVPHVPYERFDTELFQKAVDVRFPIVFNGHNLDWDCYTKWSDLQYLRQAFEPLGEFVVNKSTRPDGMFASNYIQEIHPDACQEINMTFDDFITASRTDKKAKYYVQQVRLLEVEQLSNDVDVPDMVYEQIPAEVALWITLNNVYSSLHYDQHNNILMQIAGTKKVILIPPTEEDKMYVLNKYGKKEMCVLNKASMYQHYKSTHKKQ